MTKYGLAAALIAIIGLLVFGFAREFVPMGDALVMEGELDLEPVEPLVADLEQQDGVSAVDLRLIEDEADGSRRLFGRYTYQGVTIWVRAEFREFDQRLEAESFRRRFLGAADPESSRRGLEILLDAVARRATCIEALAIPPSPMMSVGRPCIELSGASA